jgi:hypothetical protein
LAQNQQGWRERRLDITPAILDCQHRARVATSCPSSAMAAPFWSFGPGHLVGWYGVHEMAFSGAVAGLPRSVALETVSRRIRANLIAVELPDAKTHSNPTVAGLAAFLLSPWPPPSTAS